MPERIRGTVWEHVLMYRLKWLINEKKLGGARNGRGIKWRSNRPNIQSHEIISETFKKEIKPVASLPFLTMLSNHAHSRTYLFLGFQRPRVFRRCEDWVLSSELIVKITDIQPSLLKIIIIISTCTTCVLHEYVNVLLTNFGLKGGFTSLLSSFSQSIC